MYNVIDRHNVIVNGSAREVLMLTSNENDENVASYSKDIQDSQLRLAEPNVSEEETNYFKISTLLLGIAPRAVKINFDVAFPPEHLRDTLSLNIERLTELKNNRSINPEQWNSMFPSTGYPTSEFFDTTLMICLFRNLRATQISHQFPPPKDLSFEADLSRIILYRKEIANSKDRVFTNAKFTAYWNEAEAAVIRLSGGKLKEECGKLKIKLYDIAGRQKIFHKVQAGKKLAQIEVLDIFEKLNFKQQEKEGLYDLKKKYHVRANK
ncbi:Hypothetical predicted protein [Mytilus galloprovincialis]|uniref:DZIP3-like HEPN domain-containing protein n=1 Tax=Mytilus galloprovincialis TaxID=29158 RepID=A0A8B6G1U1_MYTGA|nr:Hypothetical predicted protein [Mytilus galloprovincialis]